MLRLAMLAALVSCCGLLAGCCSGPCGPGGGGGCGVGFNGGYGGGCGDECGGCGSGWDHRYATSGPLQSWHHMKKRMVCGWGCGETYYGEWRSHPPDCVDPCEFDYACDSGGFGGGGFACGGCGGCNECCLFSPPPRRRPFINLFASIYGDRYCEGCDYGCDDCGGYGGEYYDSGYYGGGGGCASGDCGGYASNQNQGMRSQGMMSKGMASRGLMSRMAQRRPMMRRGNLSRQQMSQQQNMPPQQMAQTIPEPKRVARKPTTGRQR